jgi:hypothetical protein
MKTIAAFVLTLPLFLVTACGSDGGRKPIVTGPQPPSPPLTLYQPDQAAPADAGTD